MEIVHGAESWGIDSGEVSLRVTREAGMLAPVGFSFPSGREVSPYSISPWKPQECDESLPSLLKVLRGDFLCLPFGPQEDGQPHGESANADWSFVEQSGDSLRLELQDKATGANVQKILSTVKGQTAVYICHEISGLQGKWSYGNHPILDCSEFEDRSVRISVSPYKWASVYDGIFSAEERKEKQALKPSALFTELEKVPLKGGGCTDLTKYPSREGFEDLVMLVNEASSPEQPFAWSAAVFDGWVWISIKNVDDFPATLFWISNGGRHGAPWNGVHTKRIGIEEVCSHFCDPVTVSRESALEAEGIVKTTRPFSQDTPVRLPIVQAAFEVPKSFGKISSIKPAGEGRIQICDEHGSVIEEALDWSFVL